MKVLRCTRVIGMHARSRHLHAVCMGLGINGVAPAAKSCSEPITDLDETVRRCLEHFPARLPVVAVIPSVFCSTIIFPRSRRSRMAELIEAIAPDIAIPAHRIRIWRDPSSPRHGPVDVIHVFDIDPVETLCEAISRSGRPVAGLVMPSGAARFFLQGDPETRRRDMAWIDRDGHRISLSLFRGGRLLAHRLVLRSSTAWTTDLECMVQATREQVPDFNLSGCRHSGPEPPESAGIADHPNWIPSPHPFHSPFRHVDGPALLAAGAAAVYLEYGRRETCIPPISRSPLHRIAHPKLLIMQAAALFLLITAGVHLNMQAAELSDGISAFRDRLVQVSPVGTDLADLLRMAGNPETWIPQFDSVSDGLARIGSVSGRHPVTVDSIRGSPSEVVLEGKFQRIAAAKSFVDDLESAFPEVKMDMTGLDRLRSGESGFSLRMTRRSGE